MRPKQVGTDCGVHALNCVLDGHHATRLVCLMVELHHLVSKARVDNALLGTILNEVKIRRGFDAQTITEVFELFGCPVEFVAREFVQQHFKPSDNQLEWISFPESLPKTANLVVLVHEFHFNVCELNESTRSIGLYDWSNESVLTFNSFQEFGARVHLERLQGLIFVDTSALTRASVADRASDIQKYCTNALVSLGMILLPFQYLDDQQLPLSANTDDAVMIDSGAATASFIGHKRKAVTVEGMK